MITVVAKKERAICTVECCECFQTLMFKMKNQKNYDECPHCTNEIPSPQGLMESAMARIAYFYSAEDEMWYD